MSSSGDLSTTIPDLPQHGAGEKSNGKIDKIIFKNLTWLAFAVAAGLLPLARGSMHSFNEAMANGELYLVGEVVILAALGDLLYATLPLSKPKLLKLRKKDMFSFLFLVAFIVCVAMLLINAIPAAHMPPINQEELEKGNHESYNFYYWIYALTVIASTGTVTLGASIDE
ncbi:MULTISPECIES: hypothetical protein [unclassified Streptomyces]|uniref:hypothetical protein n=1 Tax=unclassified Streptomyces TaxID=2593676 RepID=UPI002E0D4EEC|nr:MULTISPECIES: hypothetical protein [unclassified Streptomyces]WSR23487.1 hypothetical protein OG573_33205 [Streptomyces sp. NBC_01205]